MARSVLDDMKLKLHWEFAAFLKQCTCCEQKCTDSKQHQMMRIPTFTLANSSSVAEHAQLDDVDMFSDDMCTRFGCRSCETGRFRGETCYGLAVSTAESGSAPGHRESAMFFPHRCWAIPEHYAAPAA